MATHTPAVRNGKETVKQPNPSKTHGQAKKTAKEDKEDTPAADPKAPNCVTWNSLHTDHLVKWLENNVKDRQRLFSDSAQDAKKQKRHILTAKKSGKTDFHVKMANYIFLVDNNMKVRDDLRVNRVVKYVKAVKNCIGSLKRTYREINTALGQMGAGLSAEEIRLNPDLSNILDKLKVDYKLPFWERLHGFWRTLPNFNPHVVLSEPGQDLEGKAQELFFPSCGNGNVSEEDEPRNEVEEDKIEDTNLIDMVEGAAGLTDVNHCKVQT